MDVGADLLRKLQVRAGARMALLNAPDHLAAPLKVALGSGVAKIGQPFDAVLAFCETPSDVERLSAQALAGLPEDGLLWFAYRKGAAGRASGLTRDVGWGALAAAGYRGVRSISIDDDWTGIRFRELSKVKAGA